MLGEIIKNVRAKVDMTIETLANKVDITERLIYRRESLLLFYTFERILIPASSMQLSKQN